MFFTNIVKNITMNILDEYFLMNIFANFMSKRPKYSPLLCGWTQCTINTTDCVFFFFFFCYIQSYYKGHQFLITFAIHRDEFLEIQKFCLLWNRFSLLSLFHRKKAFPTTQRNYFSNITTWWHSSSSWWLHLSVPLCFTFSVPHEYCKKFLFTMNSENQISYRINSL